MPQSLSAKKRVRQSTRRNLSNRSLKSEIRSCTKRVAAAVEAGDAGRAAADLRLATKKLDKAAKRGVIHRNTAARKKARLSRMVARIAAPGA